MSDVKSFFEKAQDRINEDAIKDLDCVFQFDIGGDEGGDWNVVIAHGKAAVNKGVALNPDVKISIAAVDFVGVLEGTLHPQTAFLTGKLRLEGNMGLAMRLRDIFASTG